MRHNHFYNQKSKYDCYLLTRFTSAGSIFSVIAVSPSMSSSSDSSLDDPLVACLTGTADLCCVAGNEGMPTGALAFLSCGLDKSYPAPT